MIADEIHKLATGNAVLNHLFKNAIIELLDGMFNQLDAGLPPSMIDGLKNCDQEEVVQFLCAYHKIKIEQEQTK